METDQGVEQPTTSELSNETTEIVSSPEERLSNTTEKNADSSTPDEIMENNPEKSPEVDQKVDTKSEEKADPAPAQNNRNNRNNTPRSRNGQQQRRPSFDATVHLQHQLASLSGQSHHVSGRKERKYSKIETTITVRSYSMARYLKQEIELIALSASDCIPLVQMLSRAEGYEDMFSQFIEETTSNVKKVCDDIEEMVDVLKSNHDRIERRLSQVTMADPEKFQIVFLDPYFWSFIDMIEDADRSIAKLEKLSMTGFFGEELDQSRRDGIDFVRNAFTALRYLSKIRTRRESDPNLQVEKVNLIQKNYRKRVASLINESVEPEETTEQAEVTDQTK